MKIAFLVFIVISALILGYKISTAEVTCFKQLAQNIETCSRMECLLSKHPYTQKADKAKIYGRNKDGKCVYRANTGQVRVRCKFPPEMWSDLSYEFRQKDRAERHGPITKSRVGWKDGTAEGVRIKTAEILIKGRWEEFEHTMHDALLSGDCRAFNMETKKYIKYD